MHGYTRLDADKIVATATALKQRVKTDFPKTSLAGLAAELVQVALGAETAMERVRRPYLLLRLLKIICATGLVAGLYWTIPKVQIGAEALKISDLAQAVAATVEIVVYLGVVFVFLASVETRLKRRRVLALLAELRSLAHVVDLHQTGKDAVLQRLSSGSYGSRAPATAKRLTSYFDCCCEILSLVGILAALYVQEFPDQIAMEAAEQVEDLTTGVSQRAWQRAMLLRGMIGPWKT